MQAIGNHPAIDVWKNYFIGKLENVRLPFIINNLNNDEEFKILREEIYPGIALAHWYKNLNRNELLYSDLIDSENISGLESESPFNSNYWKGQSKQFLYFIPSYGCFVLGGVSLGGLTTTSEGEIDNATQEIITNATTQSYVQVNDTYYYSTVATPNLAELEPLAIAFTSLTPGENDNINITVAIENNGKLDANNFTVYFYDKYTYPTTGYTTIYSIGKIENVSLIIGDVKLINVSWNATNLGDHNFSAKVDYENKVTEINEINNDISSVIEVVSQKPTAEIIAPNNGNTYSLNSSIVFVGYGTDNQEGYLPEASYNWTSSLDGYLGNGSVLEHNLTVGEHVITLTVNDSDSYKDVDEVEVNVIS